MGAVAFWLLLPKTRAICILYSSFTSLLVSDTVEPLGSQEGLQVERSETLRLENVYSPRAKHKAVAIANATNT